MLVAMPHNHETKVNSNTLTVNRRTAPKRCASHPVIGRAIPLATANDVITQVP